MSLAGTVAGDIGELGIPITVYLYEGNIQKKMGMGRTGRQTPLIDYAGELSEGDYVEIFDDAAITYNECRGLPVMRAATAVDGPLGEIINIEPARNLPSSDSAVTALATMLSQDLLRRATVQIYGLRATKSVEMLVEDNGSPYTLPVADFDKVGFSVTKGWMYVASGGVANVIPFHRVVGSGSVDVTLPVLLGMGVFPCNKVA